MAARRSKEELILDLEARLKKLRDEVVEVKVKEIKLTKESPGFAEAVAAIENAAELNAVAVGEIIKTLSRIKRTGLKIENATRNRE